MNEHHLRRTIQVSRFQTGPGFVNRAGAIAEKQGHHPDLLLSWGKVEVTVYTHKIDGLTESDFILAAKIDRVFRIQIKHKENTHMLGVGQKFPAFELDATVSTESEKRVSERSPTKTYKGKWKVYFFWPKDFTFVCPTEIAAFGKLNGEFRDRDAQVLGGSTDSEFVHLAWRAGPPDLKDLPFPMLADIKRELCAALGILDPKAGVAQRATFVVDPEGIIRFVSVNDLSVGRNPQEVLRVHRRSADRRTLPLQLAEGRTGPDGLTLCSKSTIRSRSTPAI